jgi:hypothetical protein
VLAAAEERIQEVSQARGGRRAVGMDVERVEERMSSDVKFSVRLEEALVLACSRP